MLHLAMNLKLLLTTALILPGMGLGIAFAGDHISSDGQGGYWTSCGHVSSDGQGGYWTREGHVSSDGQGGYWTRNGHVSSDGQGGFWTPGGKGCNPWGY